MNIDVEMTEDEVCEMINEKLIICKIDRVEGILHFKSKKSENEVLNEWGNEINTVLELIDKTCNLIKR